MRYRVTATAGNADKRLVCMGLGSLVVTVEVPPMGTLDAEDVPQVTAALETLVADIQDVVGDLGMVAVEWVPDRTAIAASATCYGLEHLHGLAVMEELR